MITRADRAAIEAFIADYKKDPVGTVSKMEKETAEMRLQIFEKHNKILERQLGLLPGDESEVSPEK